MREYLEPPVLPTIDQIQHAEAAVPGTGKQMIEAHFRALAIYDKRVTYILEQQTKDREYFRKNQALSIISGVFLALSSIALSGVAVIQEANLVHVAMVLGPVTGLAGVFLWGYRPRDEQESKEISASEQTSANLKEPVEVKV